MRRKTIGIIGTHEVNAAGVASQRAAESYPLAVARMTGAVPLIIPSIPEVQDIGHLIEILDGIVLTGARPNVHPEEYGHEETEGHAPFDRNRDAVALPLVRAAVDAGLPLFAICRGLQEINVAYGGTLHPEIGNLPGRLVHRMPKGETDRNIIFAPRQNVRLITGGAFARILGTEEIVVNSLHGQAIDEAGKRILIEGLAEDGTPEAISVREAPGFALGVQWHAEWEPWDDPVNGPLWRAFGAAAAGGEAGSA
jgi:putative glutamine amidotransferase